MRGYVECVTRGKLSTALGIFGEQDSVAIAEAILAEMMARDTLSKTLNPVLECPSWEELTDMHIDEQTQVEREAIAFWLFFALITAVPIGFIVYFLLTFR